MAEVWLGLGSNLGDRVANLRAALERLAAFCEIVRVSSFHDTEPVGYKEQGRFLNAAAHVRTALEPRQFLERILGIEREMGRVRTIPNGPRIIDIDILSWDSRVIDEPGLKVPHPRLGERLFVLAPLAEIAPDLVHPLSGRTVRESLHALQLAAGGEDVEPPRPPDEAGH